MSELVWVPGTWSRTPFFAAKVQSGPREFVERFSNRPDRVWTIGTTMRGRPLPALNVNHLKVLLVILNAHGRHPLMPGYKCEPVTLRWLCSRMYANPGGKDFKRVYKLIEELSNTYCNIDHKIGFPLLSTPTVKVTEVGQLKKLELLDLTFHDGFIRWMREEYESDRMKLLNFDAFMKLDSPIARSLYMYLPSRAVKHKNESAWSIKLTTALTQVGATVPKFKSRRKQVFDCSKSNRNLSVIDQLHGAALANGSLKCGLELTSDRLDYKLIMYAENDDVERWRAFERNTKLYQAWMLKYSSHGEEKYFELVNYRRLKKLTAYELGKLKSQGVQLKAKGGKATGNEKFFVKVKSLIGAQAFERIITLGIPPQVKKRTGYMIGTLLKEL